MRTKPPLFNFPEKYRAEKHRQALKIKILETGSLVLDHHMVHPFVRVHIVNLDTCKYLAKEDRLNPSVANIESAGFMDSGKNYTYSNVDFLMPFSTQMYDLRVKGMNFAQWHEEFIINENAKYIMQPNVIFLFEILEFNTNMIFESPELLNADNLYPIAWAYLRPVGAAQIHLSRTRLQLYKYKFKYDAEVKKSRLIDPRTPPVFLEFNWPNKV
jgi:jouberin